MNLIQLNNGTEVFISGGTFDTLLADEYDYETSKYHIIGYDLAAVPYGSTYDYGGVSGYWNDDTAFNIAFMSEYIYPLVVLHDGVIPAFCANKPDCDVTGDCVVNSIDLAKMASEWLADGTQ